MPTSLEYTMAARNEAPTNAGVLPPNGGAFTVIPKDSEANTLDALNRGAVKLDSGKPAWDLLPYDALDELAKLYSLGAQKYESRNWERGFRYGRTFAAMMRHATLWFTSKIRGDDGKDPETGLSHMVAVAWNALALVTFELRGIGEDDRPTRTPQ